MSGFHATFRVLRSVRHQTFRTLSSRQSRARHPCFILVTIWNESAMNVSCMRNASHLRSCEGSRGCVTYVSMSLARMIMKRCGVMGGRNRSVWREGEPRSKIYKAELDQSPQAPRQTSILLFYPSESKAAALNASRYFHLQSCLLSSASSASSAQLFLPLFRLSLLQFRKSVCKTGNRLHLGLYKQHIPCQYHSYVPFYPLLSLCDDFTIPSRIT